MLRETTFWVGGALTIGLGLALAAGLVWAGAGPDFSSAYLGSAFGVVLGSFFLYVGSAEARARRASLSEGDRAGEEPRTGPDRPP
ncbi:MAG: hypothetical protein L3K02_04015 [Thermoplasmata archaeon]|nr:hypothetical protein [Thermoplasmata archaeon]